jgi:hypothetical protein
MNLKKQVIHQTQKYKRMKIYYDKHGVSIRVADKIERTIPIITQTSILPEVKIGKVILENNDYYMVNDEEKVLIKEIDSRFLEVVFIKAKTLLEIIDTDGVENILGKI